MDMFHREEHGEQPTMRILGVHPGPLMYSKIFLRLEPLGLELVAAAALQSGHDVRLIDLQVDTHRDYQHLIASWHPEAVVFSCNYLANVPEVLDLAKLTKELVPQSFVCVGGHSASFVAEAILTDSAGAVDCVLRGEGEAGIGPLLEMVQKDRTAITQVPGVVSPSGSGPAPVFVQSLDDLQPARHLLRKRRKYFIGHLDPCASIEFSRGCPWDCSFCSAWTFYGRSYRMRTPESIVKDLQSIREPGVFIVDDVAFIQERHGLEIAEAIARAGIQKKYYLETRGDVLLRNRRVFERWKAIGLQYMFLGIEALDESALKRFRKRTSLRGNNEALDFARSLGITVAVNIIADPDWDADRFDAVRDWCLEVPEVVNISINTPYPGTESWVTETRRLETRDYRLFDIQHCVLPTRLPLAEFYRKLVETQQVLNKKHLGWRALRQVAFLAGGLLAQGQTNFIKMLWKFNSVYNAERLLNDHRQPVRYEIPQRVIRADVSTESLYVHGVAAGARAGARRRSVSHGSGVSVEP
jgi:hopanoid C-3 methylase HpnR